MEGTYITKKTIYSSLLFPMLMYFMYLHRPADIVK